MVGSFSSARGIPLGRCIRDAIPEFAFPAPVDTAEGPAARESDGSRPAGRMDDAAR